MNGTYRVIKMRESDVEKEINAAAIDGWEVIASYVARFMYGLGGEYQVKEVEVILRRIASADPVALPEATDSRRNS